MAFELTPEFAKENGLSEEQVTNITTFGTTVADGITADLKKEYDETYKNTANTNAEGIITGALKLISDKTGVVRNDGEKAGEYIPRAWGAFSKTEGDALAQAKADYDDKLKNFDGDPATKAELKVAQDKLHALQEKTASFDDIVEFKEKYETLSIEHLSMKEKVVFGNVRPNFPDTVDEYRVTAKWNEFMDGVKKDYTVEMVDGESIAIDKENPSRTVKIKDLLAKDETISKLLEGRKQDGPGGKPVGKITVEGVPFEVPKEADGKTIQKLIKDHLTGKGLGIMSSEYSTQFGDLYTKIRERKTA